MDIDLFRGLVTLVLFLLFIALILWAWSDRRRADFEAAARLAVDDDDAPRSGEAR
jgi:cytochrome c oxidase cbb3-type subunit 4